MGARVLRIWLIAMVSLAALLSSVHAQDQAAVPMSRANPARTGEMPGPGPSSEPVVKWQYDTGAIIYSSPAVVDGVVYVG
ncbi:MAG TPA: PQQ-binding-like beta-propeller repeat protein, partial [Thermomicrobiales bacterium]|nr:PQQ-binding-like beta-propeller repeat protein [Thermomicrobiales bacterium]